ncbi:KxYKxGKxW signal peptide domain-containing protein [Enterococcus dongliensis]|uniref:KxYKxGKxW signal peptide domain-containing protein n=1 Tax=Enterococcus dongliensis TaxID=2559925 RepID=A0AAW8TIC6_9ENTE|nr:KxYKxGKxW signal peptide domain-containing protein [Enterococcus dongliensis]MDT2634731.1 KxYKxGKxW signal peptide domain-containing protein [Enterococcus dongliensis]MDT2637783.1 KxYKxGKxW signal peptide domain-containing protein [Enterococcus dongliensis]MDT2642777.1 KxYKxGKxW signal peptide domain-containing protein [Enterococcus dongliensis]
MERKVRYKLHKRRKQWVKIAVVVLGGFILSVSVGEEANASSEIEQTQDPTSQVSQIIEPEEVPISTESTIETDTVEPQWIDVNKVDTKRADTYR